MRPIEGSRILKSNNAQWVKKHPSAINEASEGKRPPRSAAATDTLFLPALATVGGYRSWDLSGGLVQTRSSTLAAATGIQRSKS